MVEKHSVGGWCELYISVSKQLDVKFSCYSTKFIILKYTSYLKYTSFYKCIPFVFKKLFVLCSYININGILWVVLRWIIDKLFSFFLMLHVSAYRYSKNVPSVNHLLPHDCKHVHVDQPKAVKIHDFNLRIDFGSSELKIRSLAKPHALKSRG